MLGFVNARHENMPDFFDRFLKAISKNTVEKFAGTRYYNHLLRNFFADENDGT
jgi:hypothetical protein